ISADLDDVGFRELDLLFPELVEQLVSGLGAGLPLARAALAPRGLRIDRGGEKRGHPQEGRSQQKLPHDKLLWNTWRASSLHGGYWCGPRASTFLPLRHWCPHQRHGEPIKLVARTETHGSRTIGGVTPAQEGEAAPSASPAGRPRRPTLLLGNGKGV